DAIPIFQEIDAMIPEDFLARELSLNLITLAGMSVRRFGAGVAAEAHADVNGKCGEHELPCGEAEYMVQALVGAGFNVARLPLGAAELKVGGSVARRAWSRATLRSEEHTSELQSRENLVCRLLLEKKKKKGAREDVLR